MKKAAIIHGTKGSPQGSWFQDVAAQLEAKGYQAIVPQFPTPERQSLENWFACFHANIGELDQNSILIGHSLGAIFALRVLERQNAKINAAVLVAGFTGVIGLPEYDVLNSTFVATSYNWEKIRANAAHIICLSGDDDPYVPFEQGKQIADSLAVKHHIISGGGHLNAEAGFTNFPRLIIELTNLGVLG